MAEIDLTKLTKLYYSIGELASMLDVNASLLRFWEKEFQLQVVKKNAKGNRMYSIKEIATINKIYTLVKIQGYTLDGAKTQLNLSKAHSDPKRNTQKDSIIERLESIRDRLKELKTS